MAMPLGPRRTVAPGGRAQSRHGCGRVRHSGRRHGASGTAGTESVPSPRARFPPAPQSPGRRGKAGLRVPPWPCRSTTRTSRGSSPRRRRRRRPPVHGQPQGRPPGCPAPRNGANPRSGRGRGLAFHCRIQFRVRPQFPKSVTPRIGQPWGDPGGHRALPDMTVPGRCRIPPGRLPPPVRRPAVRPRTIGLRHGIAKGHGGFRPGPSTWRRSSPSGPRRGNGPPPRRQGAVPHPGAGFRRPRTRQAAPSLRSGRRIPRGTPFTAHSAMERPTQSERRERIPPGVAAPRAGRFGSEGASMAKEASFAGFVPSLPGPVSCRHSSKADRGRQSRSCHLPSSPFLFVFPQRHVWDSFRSPAGDSPEKPAGIRPLCGVSP
jgi:hypothetical protein